MCRAALDGFACESSSPAGPPHRVLQPVKQEATLQLRPSQGVKQILMRPSGQQLEGSHLDQQEGK